MPESTTVDVPQAAAAPAGLALAESLYLAQRYSDALVVGQSLLTRPAASDRELAAIHRLVAQCLTALGERRMAARHEGLAAAGVTQEGPLRRWDDSAPATARPSARGERCFLFVASQPAYWPAERRRRG